MTSMTTPTRTSFGQAMPNLMDTYTLQFYGMERDELEYARDRFQRSARARRRVLWRLWARNRATGLLGAIIALGILAALAWAMMRILGTGLLLQLVGSALTIAAVLLLSRAKRFPAFADRWAHEEHRARDLYKMDRDSARCAARLYRERWSS